MKIFCYSICSEVLSDQCFNNNRVGWSLLIVLRLSQHQFCIVLNWEWDFTKSIEYRAFSPGLRSVARAMLRSEEIAMKAVNLFFWGGLVFVVCSGAVFVSWFVFFSFSFFLFVLFCFVLHYSPVSVLTAKWIVTLSGI